MGSGPAFLIPAIFVLDRLVKIHVLRHFTEGESIPVVPGVFHLTRVNNTGAAFGMLKGATYFLTAVSLAAFLYLTWQVLRQRASGSLPRWTREWAFALVAGGALGNLVDRLLYGYVIDLFDLRVWPVFNVADAAICAGVALVILGLVRRGAAKV